MDPELINEIRLLRTKIEKMEEQIEKNNSVTTDLNNNLTNHINFVIKIFEFVKKPLIFVTNKVNFLLSSDTDNEYRPLADEDLFVG